jgi:hypothetical protein
MVEQATPKHPWLMASVVSVGIVLLLAIPVAALQTFTVGDTGCNGVLARVVIGGAFASPDGGCRHGETVRFWTTMVVVSVGLVGIGLSYRSAWRSAHRLR